MHEFNDDSNGLQMNLKSTKKQKKKSHFKSEIISCVFQTLLLASEFLAFGVSEDTSFWIFLVLLVLIKISGAFGAYEYF